MSPAWSEPTFFFAELILKRTISADIWTIPAISPAVSMSNGYHAPLAEIN
jgi:hypothetical protein